MVQVVRKEAPVPVFSPASDGCEVSRSCLDCPLPLCRYEDPYWRREWNLVWRHQAIAAAVREQGKTVNEVAKEFGIARRSVFRILRQEKDL